MATYPTQRNLALSAMDPGSAFVPRLHPGPVGPAYGRYTPWQTDSAGIRILAEVAQDVFAHDDAGIAYAPGQLWIRTYSLSSGKAIGDFDTTAYWIAVPSVLPAGYTATPWRNNRGAGGCGFDLIGAFQIDDGFGPQIFYPNYQPTLPIRLEDGPYQPLATTLNPFSGLRTYIYGPSNIRGTVGTMDFGVIGGGFSGVYISYHPGWRNVRITITMDPTSYAAAAPGSTATTTLDGSAFIVNKSDLALSGGAYRYSLDTGPIAIAPVAQVKRMSVASSASGLNAAGLSIAASPRIDIPAPFWSSYGNLIAPGGIAAGTVPGY